MAGIKTCINILSDLKGRQIIPSQDKMLITYLNHNHTNTLELDIKKLNEMLKNKIKTAPITIVLM